MLVPQAHWKSRLNKNPHPHAYHSPQPHTPPPTSPSTPHEHPHPETEMPTPTHVTVYSRLALCNEFCTGHEAFNSATTAAPSLSRRRCDRAYLLASFAGQRQSLGKSHFPTAISSKLTQSGLVDSSELFSKHRRHKVHESIPDDDIYSALLAPLDHDLSKEAPDPHTSPLPSRT